jgi:hypothetical protein
MLRRTAAALALTGSALALVAGAPPAGAAAKSQTLARVTACKSSDSADSRSAIFYGRMRAIDGTQQMRMRFTLVQRFGDGKPITLDFPALRAWRSSKPGVRVFGYSQTVTALEAGGDYRARIDYRWLDAAGNLLRKSSKLTPSCSQRGGLANLSVIGVGKLLGPVTDSSVYQVTVRNSGAAAASDVAVELYVDGAATDVGHIDSLGPGEERQVRITGPVCKRSLRAVVDPSDAVHETLEADNTSKFTCP